MSASKSRPPSPPKRATPLLGRLGHGIVAHPWYSIILWVVILLVCLLPAANVGKVISGTFSNPLPSNDESVRAQAAYTAAFPHAQSSPSSEIILLESPDVTGPVAKNATLAITSAIGGDARLRNVSSVESLYTAYESELQAQAFLAWTFLLASSAESPSPLVAVNESAASVWGPIAVYNHDWKALVENYTGSTPDDQANYPAFVNASNAFPSGSVQSEELSDFYLGEGPSALGFNASVFGGCLADQNATACENEAAWRALPSQLSTLYPSPATLGTAELVLGDLNLLNLTSYPSVQGVAATLLGGAVGLAPGWLLTVWQAFPPPRVLPSAENVTRWAAPWVQQEPASHYPIPIPSELATSFVNQAGTASLIIVSFNDPDTNTVNGTSVNYQDLTDIQSDVSQALASSPAYAPITAYETGSAPLDDATNFLATSALSLLLVLTILVLLVIMLLYFRAPSAPALAFAMIGIALVASFAVIYAVGTYVTSFNSEIESIVLVFLMSIGTDYSVFLLARYREELVRGTPPKEAVETTVRWAGQSITTSGLAVEVVALALTLSGISFLNELGIALLIAVFFALLVNLTVLPSVLTLVGPRIFWPNSGTRFQRYAKKRAESVASHRDPIARAGRIATTRPLAVVGLILLLSIPVVIVAIEVPVSYDITNIGLPASNPAQGGFVHLTNDFGASYSSPSYLLATFSQPILTVQGPNVPEIEEVDGLANTLNSTHGVAAVSTFVGPGGAPLSSWENYATLLPATQAVLAGSATLYVGADGETVLFNIQTNASGYSAAAIGVLDALTQRVNAYDAAHGGVTKVYFGGAAPTTQDIRSLVNQAEEEMLVGAAIGLFLLMLAILGSAFVPLLALSVIGLSILWSWAGTYFVVGILEGEALIFLLPLILLILVLGLGMDYNVLLLTRVKEERAEGNRSVEAIKDAVTHAGGVITAAAVILGGAFLLLGFTSPLALLAAIGLGIGFAVLLQAFVVQLFFTPAVLTLGKDAIWKGMGRSPPKVADPKPEAEAKAEGPAP